MGSHREHSQLIKAQTYGSLYTESIPLTHRQNDNRKKVYQVFHSTSTCLLILILSSLHLTTVIASAWTLCFHLKKRITVSCLTFFKSDIHPSSLVSIHCPQFGRTFLPNVFVTIIPSPLTALSQSRWTVLMS